MTAYEALLDRARSGDADAFADLTEPHRRELHVHCYRMLGSFDDADDAVQETLLAAWRGLATFQARASVRTWLYRVATNTCLNLARTATRRPQMTEPLPATALPATAPAPTGSEKVTWLQPYPDTLLDALPDDAPGPDACVEQNEAVSLAFVTALQLLSPRARAVLILRDVLGFTAMPPLPAVWAGRSRAAEFVAEVAFRLVPEARFVATREPAARPRRLHPRRDERAVARQRAPGHHPARRPGGRAYPVRVAHAASVRPAPRPARRKVTASQPPIAPGTACRGDGPCAEPP
jgi:RNA polymerase sigma factor (sigma-70 family)